MCLAYGVHGYGVATRSARWRCCRRSAGGTSARARRRRGGPAAREVSPGPDPRARAFGYRGSELSALRTLRENVFRLCSEALSTGPVAEVEAVLDRFRPDVVVSDSEPLVLRAAGWLSIPRIGFDHVGIIAWCRPPAPPTEALQLGRGHLPVAHGAPGACAGLELLRRARRRAA